MSNPFSCAYRAQIDSTAMARESERSANASKRRARLMASSDPKVRAQAMGNLGQLSGSKENCAIKKSSHLG